MRGAMRRVQAHPGRIGSAPHDDRRPVFGKPHDAYHVVIFFEMCTNANYALQRGRMPPRANSLYLPAAAQGAATSGFRRLRVVALQHNESDSTQIPTLQCRHARPPRPRLPTRQHSSLRRGHRAIHLRPPMVCLIAARVPKAVLLAGSNVAWKRVAQHIADESTPACLCSFRDSGRGGDGVRAMLAEMDLSVYAVDEGVRHGGGVHAAQHVVHARSARGGAPSFSCVNGSRSTWCARSRPFAAHGRGDVRHACRRHVQRRMGLGPTRTASVGTRDTLFPARDRSSGRHGSRTPDTSRIADSRGGTLKQRRFAQVPAHTANQQFRRGRKGCGTQHVRRHTPAASQAPPPPSSGATPRTIATCTLAARTSFDTPQLPTVDMESRAHRHPGGRASVAAAPGFQMHTGDDDAREGLVHRKLTFPTRKGRRRCDRVGSVDARGARRDCVIWPGRSRRSPPQQLRRTRRTRRHVHRAVV